MRNLSKSAALAVVLALATIEPAGADGPFFSQKFYGYVALSASGWMFGEAVQARQNANEAYDRYRLLHIIYPTNQLKHVLICVKCLRFPYFH